MKHANVAIADVQTLKAKRAELFKQFEAEPGKLSLAKEIRIIDDQIAEESQAGTRWIPAITALPR